MRKEGRGRTTPKPFFPRFLGLGLYQIIFSEVSKIQVIPNSFFGIFEIKDYEPFSLRFYN